MRYYIIVTDFVVLLLNWFSPSENLVCHGLRMHRCAHFAMWYWLWHPIS